MKGGMTDVRFCGTAFCIVDLMGDIEAPDRETERRAQEKQKEITFQNGVDGNICSYFFTQTRKMHGALWKENKWEAYGWMRKFRNSRR